MAEEQLPEQAAIEDAVQQPVEQNMLSQEQVNRIVAREKAKAAENARRQMQDQAPQPQAQPQQEDANRVDPDEIYKQVQERFNAEMQERQLKDQMNQVANNYLAKVEQGKKNYEDFSEVTKDFDPTAFPQLTYLLANMDNAGDVLYDLSKNPMKLAGIDRLAERAPRQALAELTKLSSSIKENRQAQMDAQNENVPQPLDAMKSSRIASSDGKMGIRDLRNQDWLRG